MSGAGRYAPSPSGQLHLGNLRTAIIAWLCARSTGREFILRIEDLDPQRSRVAAELVQIADLHAIGITFDQIAPRQSERMATYCAALDHLIEAGLTYECYCTRGEIAEALNAPHQSAPSSAGYPGTCANLDDAERAARRRAVGRPPTIRFRGQSQQRSFHDAVHGPVTATVDDVVLRRFDGAIAYNLAVTVDDTAQCVDQIVRGADLLGSTPTQIAILEALGAAIPHYVHVPLVLALTGSRLAKRDGAVSLEQLRMRGYTDADVRRYLLHTLGPAVSGTSGLSEACSGFELAALPHTAVRFNPAEIRRAEEI